MEHLLASSSSSKRALMHTDSTEWVLEWFEKHATRGTADIRTETKENYFEKGWIDSFTFISFISDLEDAFDIHFLNEEFQDRSFSTIAGLAHIIEKKRHAKK